MEDQNQKIQEMQMLEQNLHNILMQKQVLNMELSETESALKEMGDSGDEAYKIIGQLMVKFDKEKLKGDLSNKQRLLALRTKKIEEQEKTFSEKLEKLREDFLKKQKK